MHTERLHGPGPAPGADAPRARAVRWLRRSYRTGAVVDAAATVGLICPDKLWPLRFARSADSDPAEFGYGMGAGAALMAGWTHLLLWADRQPLQRKDVLPLTMLVVAGLMANDERARRAGLTSARELAPTRGLQLGLLALFGASYRHAAVAARSKSSARRDQ